MKDAWAPLLLPIAITRPEEHRYVPPHMYDLDAHNQISFRIYEALLASFDECDKLLSRSSKSRYLNVAGVFFHELLRSFCMFGFANYDLSLITDRNNLGMPPNDPLPPSRWAFPVIGYEQFFDQQDTRRTPSQRAKLPILNLRSTARQLFIRLMPELALLTKRNKKRLLFTPNIPESIPRLSLHLNRESNERWLFAPISKGHLHLNIPYLKEQLQILKKQLVLFLNQMKTPVPFDENRFNHLCNRIEHEIINRTSEGESPRWDNVDVLLTGSLLHPEARIAAINAKRMGIPVVNVAHGESAGALDEPIFGYGEYALSDYLIGYGLTGCKDSHSSVYHNKPYPEKSIWVPSSSDICARYYTARKIPKIEEMASPRIMYLPTSFSGSDRYGPYRDLHDVAYYEWQRQLMAAFGQKFPSNVTWKLHIKGFLPELIPPVSGVTIRRDPRFESIMDQADIYVFDYFSSALVVAMSTSQPIIYFDIGLRNPTTKALEAIKKRCVYVKADPQDAHGAFVEAMSQQDKLCTNTFTNGFSILSEPRPRLSSVADVLQLATTPHEQDDNRSIIGT